MMYTAVGSLFSDLAVGGGDEFYIDEISESDVLSVEYVPYIGEYSSEHVMNDTLPGPYCDRNNSDDLWRWALWCERRFNHSRAMVEDCFIEHCYFPKYMFQDLWMMILMTVAYTAIMLSGIVGNVSTAVVMAFHSNMKRTSTNRYLLNLALADLVTLVVGLPFDILTMWQQYPWPLGDTICHLKGLITEFTSYVSVLTILMFSLERYLAVCHSFRVVYLSYQKYISYNLAGLWILAAVFAIPFAIRHEAGVIVETWPLGDGQLERSRICMIALFFDVQLKVQFFWLFHFSALIFFVIPLIVLVVIYVSIAMTIEHSYEVAKTTLRKSSRRLNRPSFSSTTNELTNRKVNAMLGLVVVSFFACYAPFQLQRLAFFHLDNHTLNAMHVWLYPLSGVLFYSSSILNPIVYNLMSRRYRQAFKQVLNCHFRDVTTTDGRVPSSSSHHGIIKHFFRKSTHHRSARYNSKRKEVTIVANACDTPRDGLKQPTSMNGSPTHRLRGILKTSSNTASDFDETTLRSDPLERKSTTAARPRCHHHLKPFWRQPQLNGSASKESIYHCRSYNPSGGHTPTVDRSESGLNGNITFLL